jgi:hypothetical protein
MMSWKIDEPWRSIDNSESSGIIFGHNVTLCVEFPVGLDDTTLDFSHNASPERKGKVVTVLRRNNRLGELLFSSPGGLLHIFLNIQQHFHKVIPRKINRLCDTILTAGVIAFFFWIKATLFSKRLLTQNMERENWICACISKKLG